MTYERGDLVTCWFDTGLSGAMGGPAIVYGVVEKAGPKTATVRWESGRRNRVPHDSHHVKPIMNLESAAEARKALAK